MSLELIVLNTFEILFFPLIVFIVSLPNLFRYIKRSRGTFIRRFYLPSKDIKPGGLWFQASSVGEARIAVALARRLSSVGVPLYLFAMSPEGRLVGKDSGVFTACFMAPADIFFIVRSFLKKVRPSRLVLVELQLWPNLIDQARRFTKIVLVNGRISDRSYPRYVLIRKFTKKLLGNVSRICARTARDASRFVALGAGRKKISITGNVKYDIMTGPAPSASDGGKFVPPAGVFIITAGSTHGAEDEMVIDAASSLPGKVLCIIAPRHVERAGEIEKILRKRNMEYRLYSRGAGSLDGVKFLIVDAFGVLPSLYRISDVCFVGGSLVPHGGQNFIEAVAIGKPVVVGPHNENFRQEFEVMRAGLTVVYDAQGLSAAFLKLMGSQAEREHLAGLAFEKLKSLTGPLGRNAEAVMGV